MSSIDVVCVDDEILLVAKEIKKSLASLSDGLCFYGEALLLLQENGIQDELIRKKIYDFSEVINRYVVLLEETYQDFDKVINAYLKQIKANDKLTFPYNETISTDVKINMF